MTSFMNSPLAPLRWRNLHLIFAICKASWNILSPLRPLCCIILVFAIICCWGKNYINLMKENITPKKYRFNMIVWFFWPQVFDLAANPINFTWVVCSRGSQGQIQVMQNDKGVSIKYLQEARRAFQYRANSNISAHALSWKRKEDATICGKDKSAQRIL